MADDKTKAAAKKKEDETETAAAAGTSTYRILGGTYGRVEDGDRKRYKPGDQVELTPQQAARLGDRVQPLAAIAGQFAPSIATTEVTADTEPGEELLTGPPTSKGTAEGEAEANDWSSRLQQLNAQDAVKALKDVEDRSELEVALRAERDGLNRSTVTDAVEKRMKQLD